MKERDEPSLVNEPDLSSLACTNIDKIRAYKADYAIVTKALEPALEAAIAEAQRGKQPFTKVIIHLEGEQSFVSSVYASALHASVMLYKLMPAQNSFEAIAYDQKHGMYCFFDGHFFQRYAERMNIQHLGHLRVLHHYVERNPKIEVQLKRNPRNYYMQPFTAVLKTGVIYGTKEAANIVVFRTIIDHYSLTKVKRKQTKRLLGKLLHSKRHGQGWDLLK